MKARLLSSFNNEELITYRSSAFYQRHVLAQYQFTESAINYYCEYFGNEFKNQSILVLNELNVVVLAIYAYSRPLKYTHFESGVSVIESNFDTEAERNRAYKTLIVSLKEYLHAYDFKEIHFYNNQFLLAEFYNNITCRMDEVNSYVNLLNDFDQIKSNLRKSYKSLVNWGERNLQISLLDHTNCDQSQFYNFRDFHIRIAERETRSRKSWDLQLDSIRNDDAYLVISYYNNVIVSSTYVLKGKFSAYYGVGVYDRKLMAEKVAVAHYNLYYSICVAKKMGLKRFELGSLEFDSKIEKDLSIFRFKTGFTDQMDTSTKFIIRL